MALPSVGLVRKLISVLEAVEKLSVHTYEPSGQVLNLQMLHRRFKLSLERGAGAGSLVDCSGKALKIEPLVSIDGLESFLNGIVSTVGRRFVWGGRSKTDSWYLVNLVSYTETTLIVD